MPDSVLSLGTSLPSIMSSPAALSGAGKKDDPEKIHHAAQQFESLLISQILKGAHPDDSEGWLGTGDDEAASSAMGIAEEQFAQALSARGGLGLAALIEKGLTKSTNAIDD
jgi:Rod binding domain-containing protein